MVTIKIKGKEKLVMYKFVYSLKTNKKIIYHLIGFYRTQIGNNFIGSWFCFCFIVFFELLERGRNIR